MTSLTKETLTCPQNVTSPGPKLETIPVVEGEGGVSRDVSDLVKMRNAQAAFVYADKWQGMILCVDKFNARRN